MKSIIIPEALRKRLLSLFWRALMMGLAVFVSTILDGIGALEFSPLWTTMFGLVLGEISKYLNNLAKGK